VILTKNKIQPEYSRKGSIYVDYIWKKKSLSNFIELNQVHFNKILKKKNILNKIYSKFAEYIPKFFFKFIVVSKNNLIKDFLINNRFKYLTILTTYYDFSNKLHSNRIKILSNKISISIISMIEKSHFYLADEHKKSINFIIESNLIKIDNDFKNYNGFLKNTSIATSTMMIKRNIIGNIKFTDTKICEDFFFKCSLLKKIGNAYCLDEYLTNYRIRRQSLQSNNLRNFYWIWKINKNYNKLNIFDNLISLLFISYNSLRKYGGKNIFKF